MDTEVSDESLRRRLYRRLDPSVRAHGISPLNRVIMAVILTSVIVTVLASEPLLSQRFGNLFLAFELVAGIIFLIEYVARAWVSVEAPDNPGGWRGRIKYLLSPLAIVDLVALLPLLGALVGAEAFLLRLLRLFRILRLARLGRFSRVVVTLGDCLHARRFELGMSLVFALLLLLVSSTLLHLVEGGAQPDAFGSIPRAMWWSIATLTTVGYGDVFPVTVLGRVLAGITAIGGIGLIAMPTGILAAAFSDALARRREEEDPEEP